MGRRKDTRSVEKRFFSFTEKCDKTGCVLWRGALRGKGYGGFTIDGRMHYAHRIAYWLFWGDITPNLVIDHLCRTLNCVNWEHLEAVSVQENIRRGTSPSAAYARRTHCARGHELAASNVYVGKNMRRCVKCRRARERARYRIKAGV